MLSGTPPFVAEFVNDLIDKIKKCNYSFPDDPWEKISDNAKQLIKKLL